MNERLLKFFLILLVCVPITSTDIFVPLLPKMVVALHTTIPTISLVLTTYMVGFSLSVLTAGTLSDLYGRRIILLIAFILYSLSCLSIAFCYNIYLLIWFRFLQGLGGGSGTVVARLILNDHFKDNEKVHMMSWLSTGMAIAPAIAPQIGIWTAYKIGWHGPFLVTFVVGLFMVWIILFKLKETNLTLASYNPIKHLPYSFFKAFHSPAFLGYTLLITFSWAIYFNFIGLSSFLFQKVYSYSEHQYALVIILITTGYLIGTSLTRFFNKRHYALFSIISIGVGFCLLGGAGFLSAYFLKSAFFVTIFMTIIRFGIGFIMPTSQVGALRSSSETIGWNMGCLFFSQFAVGGLTLYLAGFLESYKMGLGLISSIAIALLILALSFFLVKPQKKES